MPIAVQCGAKSGVKELAGLQNGSTDIGFGPTGVIADESVEAHMICADPLWWPCVRMTR